MSGLNRVTGRAMDPQSVEYDIQSIGDILGTPRGSRAMRRDYGSDLPDLVDQPDNDFNRARIYAATAMALLRWYPRGRLRRVQLVDRGTGRPNLTLDVQRTDLPRRPVRSLTIPLAA